MQDGNSSLLPTWASAEATPTLVCTEEELMGRNSVTKKGYFKCLGCISDRAAFFFSSFLSEPWNTP